MVPRITILLFPFLPALAVVHAQEAALPATVEFNRDIRPILSDNCFKCHGPDAAKRKADLRLDLEADAKAKLEDDVFVIAPGNPAKSELIRRITTDDADDHMPPLDSAKQLTARQVALLNRWVEQGAKWQTHWSFVPPQRPALPAVKDTAWPRNPIDRFVLARLESEGLRPSPEADRATLIRRVTLDLTGLPATPAEVEAFMQDASPPAWERVVDRLLASPRHGERMASRWLDAARYADTNGYQSDGERTMWRWRDWVIDAYNRNLPFDQFTVEQLAGDLLPGATRAQRIATGFNRNHRGNGEGGIVPEEYAVEYVVDRVDTTSTVWLGLTMGCARCHDHKYDPIAQKEFYQTFAFFNNVPEQGQANKYGNSPPMIAAPTPAQETELNALTQKLGAAEAHLLELEPAIARAQAAWERALGASPLEWTVTNGLRARFALDGKLTGLDGAKAPAKFSAGEPAFEGGHRGPAAKLEGKRFIDAGDVGNFGFYDKFTLSAWIKPRGPDGLLISRMVTQADDPVFTTDGEGYGLMLAGGKLQVMLTKRWLDDALRVETEAPVRLGQWQHVAVVYDASRLASGVKIYVDGKLQRQKVLLDELNQSFATKHPLRIGAVAGPELDWAVSDVRVYGRALAAEEVGIVATAESLSELASVAASQRTAEQRAKLRQGFLAEHAPAPMREAHAKVAELRDQRARLLESLPTSMVMEEMATPRVTSVLKRGQYDQPGEPVTPGVPAFLSPWPNGEPRNRLGFARWLVDPVNPLTARVAVNNQWQTIFGVGLVKTTEDFGSQGEPPSHPELLDWLATEFVRTGWDQKAMLKTLVMSATYRQSSRVTPALLARDPENRLLARASRLRLPAEMIRDQALAVSGLLVGEIGGPSVKPYQPKGLWKELSGSDYVADRGDKLWRRSLYTYWKRTAPPPTMATFDAPARESCSVRPGRTSTPLQALALMNDVTFVEASRRLAQRVMLEGGTTPEERLRTAFRLVLARVPTTAESGVLERNWREHRARFRADPKSALDLVSAGESPRNETLDVEELATYAAVCGLILNLDEAITRP
jgi:mono/diheme cytochrome c family protein